MTIEYRVGVLSLGAAGGMSLAIRVVLMKEDLLVPIYYVNWIPVGVSGGIGLILSALTERWGVVSYHIGGKGSCTDYVERLSEAPLLVPSFVALDLICSSISNPACRVGYAICLTEIKTILPYVHWSHYPPISRV